MLIQRQRTTNWNPCPDPCCCPADLNGDGVVDGADLLILLASWGPCPGFDHLSDPLTLEELIEDAGLTMDDWDHFMSIMTGDGPDREKENYLCWMENYLMQCVLCPSCPGPDPFAN
jgi:hypothetical protein